MIQMIIKFHPDPVYRRGARFKPASSGFYFAQENHPEPLCLAPKNLRPCPQWLQMIFFPARTALLILTLARAYKNWDFGQGAKLAALGDWRPYVGRLPRRRGGTGRRGSYPMEQPQ